MTADALSATANVSACQRTGLPESSRPACSAPGSHGLAQSSLDLLFERLAYPPIQFGAIPVDLAHPAGPPASPGCLPPSPGYRLGSRQPLPNCQAIAVAFKSVQLLSQIRDGPLAALAVGEEQFAGRSTPYARRRLGRRLWQLARGGPAGQQFKKSGIVHGAIPLCWNPAARPKPARAVWSGDIGEGNPLGTTRGAESVPIALTGGAVG